MFNDNEIRYNWDNIAKQLIFLIDSMFNLIWIILHFSELIDSNCSKLEYFQFFLQLILKTSELNSTEIQSNEPFSWSRHCLEFKMNVKDSTNEFFRLLSRETTQVGSDN